MRLATVVLGVGVAVGCSETADSGAENPDALTSRLALVLPASANISSVDYLVRSSASVTLAAGTIDVSRAGATLSLDLVLAPGIGDVVELDATTSTGAACSGTSAPFDVTSGQPAFVGLTLVCGGDQPGSSSCPDIQSWTVTPVQAATPGGAIAVAVSATAPGATDLLFYAWIATSGGFVDPSAAATLYTCTTVGAQTLTLTVRDSGSSPPCAATASFLVSCVAGDDAGSPPRSVVSTH